MMMMMRANVMFRFTAKKRFERSKCNFAKSGGYITEYMCVQQTPGLMRM
jgi:hypothetical protein